MTPSLSSSQERVVAHREGALLVLAGPGAGKTRVLTERIRRLLAGEAGHFRVLALTFTNKAANEMVSRLSDVPEIRERAFIGTLHSFCMEVLANRGKSVGLDGLPHLFESYQDRKQALADAVAADPILAAELQSAEGPKERGATLSRWLQAISDAKAALLLPHMVEDDLERRVYEVYDAELRASSALDFDDLLLLTYRVFEETPKIAGFYRRQYRYICLDEGQDLNEAQYRLLCALCGSEHKNVMVVGDPKQAIYVWNGADPKYLDLFARDFDADRAELNDNYRSSLSVVSAAKALNPTYAVEGQLPIRGLVHCETCAAEDEEAEFVCATLQRLMEEGHSDIEGPIKLERCAVLGRNRFVFTSLEASLNEHGLPYHKKLSAGTHDPSSNVVRELELALRVVANPHDRLHTGLLARAWQIETSANDILAEFPSESRAGLDVLHRMAGEAGSGAFDLVLRAVSALSPSDTAFRLAPALAVIEEAAAAEEDEVRSEILKDLTLWREHWDQFVRASSGGDHSLKLFLSHFVLGTTEQANRDGLALLTVHSAKGMEFDVVLLIGMCEGVFPDYRSRDGAELAEEDRNAFVAVTRSKRLLYMTYPRARLMPWGDSKVQQASRYFATICNLSTP